VSEEVVEAELDEAVSNLDSDDEVLQIMEADY